MLYEDESFPQRELAALVASKVCHEYLDLFDVIVWCVGCDVLCLFVCLFWCIDSRCMYMVLITIRNISQ